MKRTWVRVLSQMLKPTFRVIGRLEGLGQLKNPMTSSGIEPATFRLVAWCPTVWRQILRVWREEAHPLSPTSDVSVVRLQSCLQRFTEFCITDQLSSPFSLSSSNNSDAIRSAPLTQSPKNPQINPSRGPTTSSAEQAFLFPRPRSNYLYVCYDKQTAAQGDTYAGLYVLIISTPGALDTDYVISTHSGVQPRKYQPTHKHTPNPKTIKYRNKKTQCRRTER
jgi:hypothetical protein